MKFTQMPQQPVKIPAYAELPPLEELTLEEFKELPDSVRAAILDKASPFNKEEQEDEG